MAVFNINGRETDSRAEAEEFVNDVWHEYKAPAVKEQHIAALSKPSQLDLERAAIGAPAPSISAGDAAIKLAANAANAAVNAEFLAASGDNN